MQQHIKMQKNQITESENVNSSQLKEWHNAYMLEFSFLIREFDHYWFDHLVSNHIQSFLNTFDLSNFTIE